MNWLLQQWHCLTHLHRPLVAPGMGLPLYYYRARWYEGGLGWWVAPYTKRRLCRDCDYGRER